MRKKPAKDHKWLKCKPIFKKWVFFNPFEIFKKLCEEKIKMTRSRKRSQMTLIFKLIFKNPPPGGGRAGNWTHLLADFYLVGFGGFLNDFFGWPLTWLLSSSAWTRLANLSEARRSETNWRPRMRRTSNSSTAVADSWVSSFLNFFLHGYQLLLAMIALAYSYYKLWQLLL